MDKIAIKIYTFGSDENSVELDNNSTLNDLRIITGYNKKSIFYKRVKEKLVEVNSEQILYDKDILYLVVPKRGEATVTLENKIWRIHMSDPDKIFPSDFHMHDCGGSGEKLDLYTGKIYNKKRCVSKLKKKRLKYMLEELKKYACYKKKVESILQTNQFWFG